MKYPNRYFISSGKGCCSEDPLVSFDLALIDASLANYNLVKVSSILPAGAVQAENITLAEGSALLTAYARIDSNTPGATPGARIATAVGVGIPFDKKSVGVIMEYSGFCTAAEAAEQVRKMCQAAMENHGIPCKEVLVSSIDALVETGYTSLVSAVSFWAEERPVTTRLLKWLQKIFIKSP